VLAVVIVAGFAFAMPMTMMEAKGPSTDTVLSKVISNIDMKYAWGVMEKVVSMKTSSLGFRGAGSASAIAASKYVKTQFDSIGLTNTALEKIPLDAWEFRSAYVQTHDLGKIQAASFGGSPGTNGAITAPLVNVGNGYDSSYQEVNVKDKIVIGNWIGDDYWVDSMAMEAYLHGAKAIIVTTYDSDYGNQPGAIECHDGLYRPYWPPLISISGDDGLKVIAELNGNPGMSVTVFSDIKMTLASKGGFGYNVVGYLPGKNWGTPQDEYLILGDHTDSWFTGGMDDTSGTAATLTLAKAFKKTFDQLKTKPDRTMIFTTHEAEEYGILNTYYDWCYGAWYQIEKVHPEWVGKSVAYINFELMGMAGLPFDSNLAPELASFVHNVFGQNNAKLPYGHKVTAIPHSWADHWTFSAAGIPGIELETVTDEWDAAYYHNQFDTIQIIDPTYLKNIFEVSADLSLRLLTLPVSPYNFETTGNNLIKTLTSGDYDANLLYPIYAKYGIDPEKNMSRTLEAAQDFLANAAELNTKLNSVSSERAHEVNVQLMSIEAILGQTLIAQGVWEDDWYPYQQSALDVIHMDDGISILQNLGPNNDVNDAIGTLNWVGIIWYYDYMCKANYLDQYSKLCGAEVASWGLQTHLLPAVEIWDEYDDLHQVAYDKNPDVSGVITSLQGKMVSQALHNLELSFETMWMGLENANGQMDTLLASL